MHENHSVAHLIGTKPPVKVSKPDPKKHVVDIQVNGHAVPYLKESVEPMSSGDVQSVAQHIRAVEYDGAKSKGHSTDDLEKPRGLGYNQPRGLGVRTASEDFVVGDED